MKNSEVTNPEEVRRNTEAFTLEEFSITELEDRLEFLARCDINNN